MTRKKNDWYSSEECREAMRLYSEGLSLNDTAKKFGVNRFTVQYAAKKYGVKSCISFMEGQRIANEKRSRGELPMPIYKRKDEFLKQTESELAIKLMEKGFNYLGGYKPRNEKPTIRICCQTCGNVFERGFEVTFGNLTCPNCRHQKVIERQSRKQNEYRTKVEQRRKELEQKRIERQVADDERLNAVHSCKVCGRDYTIRDYMQRTGMSYRRDSGFCSAECRDAMAKVNQKENKRKHRGEYNHIRRVKKFGGDYDRGITLKSAIKRFGLTCSICGEQCDLNDRSYSKYCGALYPSVDHIIPLSKGGTHTWDNVQIAHIICNSRKETTILGGDAV